MYNMYRSRGISAVGSAFEWHSKGQGFDSPMLHHKRTLILIRGSAFFLCPKSFALQGFPSGIPVRQIDAAAGNGETVSHKPTFRTAVRAKNARGMAQ